MQPRGSKLLDCFVFLQSDATAKAVNHVKRNIDVKIRLKPFLALMLFETVSSLYLPRPQYLIQYNPTANAVKQRGINPAHRFYNLVALLVASRSACGATKPY